MAPSVCLLRMERGAIAQTRIRCAKESVRARRRGSPSRSPCLQARIIVAAPLEAYRMPSGWRRQSEHREPNGCRAAPALSEGKQAVDPVEMHAVAVRERQRAE